MGNSDPEDASAFLARTNFKSVIEWLTAESILNRPEDPMTFLRDLLDMKISERGVEAYAAEHASKYVSSCYSDAARARRAAIGAVERRAVFGTPSRWRGLRGAGRGAAAAGRDADISRGRPNARSGRRSNDREEE